jgi:tRNA nucleotidyltransferase/poly(A) polymerase
MNSIVNEFMRQLESHGITLRYAGGSVRDFLMNVPPVDFDLATPTIASEVVRICESLGYNVIPTGISHGTVSVIINDDLMIEITTLRKDVETDGRHAEVEFIIDWKEDCQRRDLTINSMMMDSDGKIYDWFNGKSDLDNHILKFVGDPDKRVKEDYLRILRFFRFATKFPAKDFHFDHASLEACRNNTDGLYNISGERIWMEMKKILSSPNAGYLLSVMDNSHILDAIGFDDFFYK